MATAPQSSLGLPDLVFSALPPEEQDRLDEAINGFRNVWSHGRARRIEMGKHLLVIRAIWDSLDRGKFKAEIREVTGCPYTTALDYMAEARDAAGEPVPEIESSTNFVPEDSDEEEMEPKPFATGEPQADPQAEELEKRKQEERQKAEDAKRARAAKNQASLTLYVHQLSDQNRADFRVWMKDNKFMAQTVLQHVVSCILDPNVGAVKMMETLQGLLPPAGPVAFEVTAEVATDVLQ